MRLILIVLVLLLIFGGLPGTTWGHWHSYGWGPSGIGGIILIVLVILILLGQL